MLASDGELERSKKVQNVKFKNIDDFFEFVPQDELEIVHLLRNIIFECLPNAKEHLAFNVPHYKVHRNICFLWPASVLWGKKKTYEGVRFGFAKGYLLTDETSFLDHGTRKQVFWKDIQSPTEIDIEVIKSLLYEAALLDKEYK
ncbi:MAG: DUF1801 domain-containing protein [Flavobacteriales bacterium]